MAVRYVEIGQYPDVRREVRGNLSEILVATANPGTYAAPEDVTGTFLEMGTDGKWDGASVGTMPKATADALYASGALANLATGATYRDTSGTQYTYGAGGWAEAGGGVPSDLVVGWQLNGSGPVITGALTQTGTYAPSISGNLIGTISYIMSAGIGKVSIVDASGDYIGARTQEIQTATVRHKSADKESPIWILPSGWRLIIEDLYLGYITATIEAN